MYFFLYFICLLTSLTGIEAKELQIFYPWVHRDAFRSFAQACNYLVPGHSFSKENSILHISYFAHEYDSYGPKGFFTKEKLKAMYPNINNVIVIEVDELIQSPPDVIFINCSDQQDDILNRFWPYFKNN